MRVGDGVSAMSRPHVLYERETRLQARHNGNLELPDPIALPPGVVGIAWCDEKIRLPAWYFRGAEHALTAMRIGDSVLPCRVCLLAMKQAIDRDEPLPEVP